MAADPFADLVPKAAPKPAATPPAGALSGAFDDLLPAKPAAALAAAPRPKAPAQAPPPKPQGYDPTQVATADVAAAEAKVREDYARAGRNITADRKAGLPSLPEAARRSWRDLSESVGAIGDLANVPLTTFMGAPVDALVSHPAGAALKAMGDPKGGEHAQQLVGTAMWGLGAEAGGVKGALARAAAEAAPFEDLVPKPRVRVQAGSAPSRPAAPPVKPGEFDVPRSKEPPLAERLARQPKRPLPEARPANPAYPSPRPKIRNPVKQAQVRLEEGLGQLSGGQKANRLAAMQATEAARASIPDYEAAATKATHEVERRMIDPDAPLSPDAQAVVDHFQPYKDAVVDNVRTLKARGLKPDPELQFPVDPRAWVPRRVVGRNPGFDAMSQAAVDSPYGTRRSGGEGGKLGRNPGETKARTYKVIVLEDGSRHFVADPNAPNMEVGKSYTSEQGQAYAVKPATIAEIEAETGERYHTDYGANIMDAWRRTNEAVQNAEYLRQLLPDLEGKGLAVRESARPTGKVAPDDFRPSTLQPLDGWKFHPTLAKALDEYHGLTASRDDLANTLSAINRIGTQGLFVTHPWVHPGNVAAEWLVGRGFDNLNLPRTARTLATAFREVMGLGPEYLQSLRDGDALQAASELTHGYYKTLLGKSVREMHANPAAWKETADRLGFSSVAQMAKAVAKASHQTTWRISDMFVLARKLELKEKGLTSEQASRRLATEIPTYRVPAAVGGTGKLSRALSEAIKHPLISMFGRWHYGVVRALGETVKGVAGKSDTTARTEALGQAAALILGYVGFKAIGDSIARKATGNPDAEMNLSGIFHMMQAADEAVHGKRTWQGATATAVTPSVAAQVGGMALTGKNAWGKEVIPPTYNPAEKLVAGGEAAASLVSPASDLIDMAKPEDWQSAMWREAGIKLPSKGAAYMQSGRGRGKQRRKDRYAKRADPILSRWDPE